MIAGVIERKAACDGVHCRGSFSTQERQNEHIPNRRERGRGIGCTKASG